MARRLSGRQVLDLIFGDESEPEDNESSEGENSSLGSQYQIESDNSDPEEDAEEDDDEQLESDDGDVEEGGMENDSEESDNGILYSLADNDESDAVSDTFISKSLVERWSSNAPTARQARTQNIIKGKTGPTSYAKQRVSADNPVVDCFLVFFSSRMLDHVVECTNREGNRVKKEDWTMIDQMELKAFLGLLLLRGVYKASGESTEELWSADGRKDFPSTMSFNRFVQYSLSDFSFLSFVPAPI